MKTSYNLQDTLPDEAYLVTLVVAIGPSRLPGVGK